MKLVIVESPNKVNKIKEYLGKDYNVVASVGHITRIRNSGKFNLGIDLERKYNINYELIPEKVSVLQKIMNAVEESEIIYLATDCDMEGENISYNLFQRIKDFNKTIKRITFNKITKDAILESIENARDIDMDMVNAQQCRAALDKITGYLTSGYVSKCLSQNNLSAGRVQSPAVKLIIKREEEIEKFIPQDYWTCNVRFKFNDIEFDAKYDGKILSQKDADDISSFLLNNSSIYTVLKVQAKSEKHNPPPPMITSSLQQYAAKKLKFSADKTMEIAQNLFTNSCISYHRTDCPAISKESLKKILDYNKSQNLPMPSKPFIYTSKTVSSQDAHEAILAIDLTVKQVFGGTDANQLYNIIRQFTIASQLAPAVYDTLKVSIEGKLGNKKYNFIASGKSLKTPGFLSFLNLNDDSKINIPTLQKSDVLLLISNKIEKKHTNPPSRYSMSELLKTMEKLEIGRPSTTANILKKIVDRGYVQLKNEIYYPTELGKKLILEIDNKFDFLDYQYTATIEKQIDNIAEKKDTYFNVIDNFYTKFKTQLNNLYTTNGYKICDCGGIMIKRQSKEGKEFWGCSSYPLCRNIN
jgi:DNA topoisomerase-1